MLKWWLPWRTWPQHELLVGALNLSQSFSCYVWFWESCVDEGKEGRGKERETETAGLSHKFGRSRHLRRWRVTARLRTVKNSTGTHTFPVSSPLIPQSLSPIHLPEGDKIVNGSYRCGREQAASPFGHRAAVFLGLINVSGSSSQLSLSCRVFYRAPERQAVM